MRKKYYEDALNYGEVPALSSKKNYGDWTSVLEGGDIVLAVWKRRQSGQPATVCNMVLGCVRTDLAEDNKSPTLNIVLAKNTMNFDGDWIRTINIINWMSMFNSDENTSVLELYLISDFIGNNQREIIMHDMFSYNSKDRLSGQDGNINYARYKYSSTIIDILYNGNTDKISFVSHIGNMRFGFGCCSTVAIDEEKCKECEIIYCHDTETSIIAKIDNRYIGIAQRPQLLSSIHPIPIQMMQFKKLDDAWEFIANAANNRAQL